MVYKINQIYLLYLYIFLCLCPFISTETLLSWYPFFWFQCYLGIPNPPNVDSPLLCYKADVLNIQLSDQKVQILVNTYTGGCFSNLLLCQNQLSFKNTEYISWFTNTWNNRIKSSSVSTVNSASTNTEKISWFTNTSYRMMFLKSPSVSTAISGSPKYATNRRGWKTRSPNVISKSHL